jgi:hypothetical protein
MGGGHDVAFCYNESGGRVTKGAAGGGMKRLERFKHKNLLNHFRPRRFIPKP